MSDAASGAGRLPAVAVVLAGGLGSRVGGALPKQLLAVAGRPILAHSLAVFQDHPYVDEILVVMAAEFRSEATAIVTEGGFTKVSTVIDGGPTRDDSTRRALDVLIERAECNVLLHDAARPLVTAAVVDACIGALQVDEAVVVAVPATDTMLTVDDDAVTDVPQRARLQRAQTPQGFRLSLLRRAYALADGDDAGLATDNCSVVRRHLPEVTIRVVPGSEDNIKVTTVADVAVAEALLRRRL